MLCVTLGPSQQVLTFKERVCLSEGLVFVVMGIGRRRRARAVKIDREVMGGGEGPVSGRAHTGLRETSAAG